MVMLAWLMMLLLPLTWKSAFKVFAYLFLTYILWFIISIVYLHYDFPDSGVYDNLVSVYLKSLFTPFKNLWYTVLLLFITDTGCLPFAFS